MEAIWNMLCESPRNGLLAGLVLGLVGGWVLGRLTALRARTPNGRRRKPAKIAQSRSRRGEPQNAAVPDGAVELYVGNLSYDMTEDHLRETFEKFGKVHSARIITHRMSKRSKGFGFVIMPNRPEAMAAVKALNERNILGRALRVNEARGLSS